jgi:hypothetical protein
VQFKLAILKILAMRPDGRATFDELKGEVGLLPADPGQPGDASLDNIDILQACLVVLDDGGLRITDAGRSALEALEDSNDISLDFSSTPALPSLKRIDELVGTKQRLRIFDLELRGREAYSRPGGAAIEDASPLTAAPGVQEAYVDLPPESAAQAGHETGDAEPRGNEPAIAAVVAESMRAPMIQVRDGHDAPGREAPQRGRFSRVIAARLQQIAAIWRRHLERDAPQVEARPRRTGNMNGAAIALISFLVLALAAGAVIALAQIRSLKSEVAALQRELFPLRERVAKAELLERAKQIAEQQKGAEKSKAGAEPRTEQAAISLTPEEIRLIRDFIKPAPLIGAPAPAINIGDTVSLATIPLPSQLMEKIPKLLGARFTTRNGSIVILRRDSRQADIVLPPS